MKCSALNVDFNGVRFDLLGSRTSEFSLKYTGDRPRQPAYEIKLMLSRVP